MSSMDMLRLANNVVMSKFSASKPSIKLDNSISSNSRPNIFNIAEIVDMSISKLFKMTMRSDSLIADKS